MTGLRRLLASIHDVSPYHAERLERLVPLVEEATGVGRFALLVVPNFHRTGLVRDNAQFARRIANWAAQGCEIFLHGFTHMDEAEHDSPSARLRAKHLTAGEGEFLGLGYSSARQRLADGRAMLEDMIGRPLDGFVAPAWLYGAESLAALADNGFTLAEDHFRVWNPQTNAVLARGPVVTYASRSTPRLLSSLLWSRISTVLLARARTVRFAVHPHDVDSPALLREIRRALAAFVHSHRPASYRELCDQK